MKKVLEFMYSLLRDLLHKLLVEKKRPQPVIKVTAVNSNVIIIMQKD